MVYCIERLPEKLNWALLYHHLYECSKRISESSKGLPDQSQTLSHCCVSQLSLGYRECKDEVMRYLVEGEGMCASDSFCDRVMGHLTSAGEKLLASGTTFTNGAFGQPSAVL